MKETIPQAFKDALEATKPLPFFELASIMQSLELKQLQPSMSMLIGSGYKA